MPCERRDLLRAAAPTLVAALGGGAGATRSTAERDRAERRSAAGPAIRIPNESLVGEPIRILLGGFEPRSTVALEATATDARGVTFSTEWSRRTDEAGAARLTDVRTDRPSTEERTSRRNRTTTEERTTARNRTTSQTRATTEDRDTPRWSEMGPGLDHPDRPGIEMLLQQLTPKAESPTPTNFVVGDRNSVDVRLTARTRSGQRASAVTTRVYADPAVSRRTIHESRPSESGLAESGQPGRTESSQIESNRTDSASGLVGWLYSPPGDGPHPGLLVLHGSQAIVPHELSRALATCGYATLALRYFGADGLPESLDGVALEYFRRAARWLTDRDDVRDGAVGFVGVSRGVEAALLAAAGFPGRSAVVGYSGGGVIGPGVNRAATAVEGWEAAWTRDGEPIADAEAVRSVFSAVQAVQYNCEGVDCVSAVRERVAPAVLRRALVPAEEIDGPILLLAGANDFNWPSSALAALTIDLLERRDHAAPYQLRTYDGAGHIFGLPYQSYAGDATGPEFGGSPAANVFAAANSWPLALRYLRTGLRPPANGDGPRAGLSSSGDKG